MKTFLAVIGILFVLGLIYWIGNRNGLKSGVDSAMAPLLLKQKQDEDAAANQELLQDWYS